MELAELPVKVLSLTVAVATDVDEAAAETVAELPVKVLPLTVTVAVLSPLARPPPACWRSCR